MEKGCIFLSSGRRITRSAWRTPADEPGPAVWAAKQRDVAVDNLEQLFNFMIHKVFGEHSGQIVRQIVYILR